MISKSIQYITSSLKIIAHPIHNYLPPFLQCFDATGIEHRMSRSAKICHPAVHLVDGRKRSSSEATMVHGLEQMIVGGVEIRRVGRMLQKLPPYPVQKQIQFHSSRYLRDSVMVEDHALFGSIFRQSPVESDKLFMVAIA